MKSLNLTPVSITIAALLSTSAIAETVTHDSYVIGTNQPPIIFTDGSMAVTKQYRRGYNDYIVKYERQDFNGNLVEAFVLDMKDNLVWKAASENGDMWLYNRNQELGAWDNSTKSFSKVNVNFNEDSDTGIVNDNSHLVFFVKSSKQLTEFDNKMNTVNYSNYDSCNTSSGYFECQSGGNTVFVDPTSLAEYSNTDTFEKLNIEYSYVRNGNNIQISDNNNTVVYDYPVHQDSRTRPVAYSDNLIAFEVYNDDKIIFTDWQGNIVDTLHAFRPNSTYVFHPAGYFIYGEFKTQYFYYNDLISVSRFDTMDYLNSKNPATINDYSITLSGEITPPSENNESIMPDGSTAPGVSTSKSGGSGGSLGIAGIGLLALLGMRRRKS